MVNRYEVTQGINLRRFFIMSLLRSLPACQQFPIPNNQLR
jgi:hypothetical protein